MNRCGKSNRNSLHVLSVMKVQRSGVRESRRALNLPLHELSSLVLYFVSHGLLLYQRDGGVYDYQGWSQIRGIRVRFRRGSLKNGYHFQGGQQARKLLIFNTKM